jgi:MinD superfamily P-loop ATPase
VKPSIWPEIDTWRCNGCGKCLPACTTGALGMVAGKATLVRPELCRYDGNCELACPVDAIQVPFAVVFALPPSPPGASAH